MKMDTYAAELTTLRARVEELERERDLWRNNFSAMHQLAMRAEAAESRLSEVTRLAVEALTGMITVGEAYLPYDAPNGPCTKRLSVARTALRALEAE
jgi:hypothetical protein